MFAGTVARVVTMAALGLLHLGVLMEYTDDGAVTVGVVMWMIGVAWAMVTVPTPAVSLMVLAAVPVGMWMSDRFETRSVLLMTAGLLVMWPTVRLAGSR